MTDECDFCKDLTLKEKFDYLKSSVKKANLMSPPFVDGQFEEIFHFIKEIEKDVISVGELKKKIDEISWMDDYIVSHLDPDELEKWIDEIINGD